MADLMDLFPAKVGTAGPPPQPPPPAVLDHRFSDGLLRWQYGDRAVELRSTLRDE